MVGGTSMFCDKLARRAAAASSAGLVLFSFSSRMTRSSTVGLRSSCWIARWRSTGSIELMPRSRSADSVGFCTPIAAFDRYFFGQTATAAAPAAMQSSSGMTSHHLRRLTTAR
jgi:hypothetical protein